MRAFPKGRASGNSREPRAAGELALPCGSFYLQCGNGNDAYAAKSPTSAYVTAVAMAAGAPVSNNQQLTAGVAL